VELFYTLCYSLPQVQEITWWNITDEAAFIKDGGLLFEDYTPKPAAKTLSRLISGWLATGEAALSNEGRAEVKGAAGEYELVVEKDGKPLGTVRVELDPDRRAPVEVVLS